MAVERDGQSSRPTVKWCSPRRAVGAPRDHGHAVATQDLRSNWKEHGLVAGVVVFRPPRTRDGSGQLGEPAPPVGAGFGQLSVRDEVCSRELPEVWTSPMG